MSFLLLENKRTNSKVLFLACCPVSLKIALVIKEDLQRKYETFKIFYLGNINIPIMKILLDKRISLINKTFKIIRAFFGSKNVAVIKNLITSENPNLVIIPDDSGICTSAVKICRINNIPVLSLQVGVLTRYIHGDPLNNILRKNNYFLWTVLSRILDNKLVLRFLLCLNFRFPSLEWGLSNPDVLGVMGKYFYNLMLERRIPPEKIRIVGNPLFPTLCSVTKKVLVRSQRKHRVLLFTQPFVEDNFIVEEQYLKTLVKIIQALSNVKKNIILTIKPHPRENEEKYHFLQNNKRILADNIHITKSPNLENLIANSDLVLVFSSTTGLLARFMGKHLIVLDFFDIPYYNINKLYGIAVRNVNELKNLTKTILLGEPSIFKDRQSEVDITYFVQYSGDSAKRKILGIIDQLISGD